MVPLERAKRRRGMAPSRSPAAETGDLCVRSWSVIPHAKNTIKEFMAVFTGQGDSGDMISHLSLCIAQIASAMKRLSATESK